MQIAKLIGEKNRARPPSLQKYVYCAVCTQYLGPMISFKTKSVFVVTSHIALSQYGIVIDSKPEQLKVSEQKGPILQKSLPPG